MPFHPDYGWYDDGTDTNPNAPWDINVAARGGDPNAWWNIAAGNGATYSAPTSAMLVGDMDAIEKIKQAGLKSGYFYEGEDDAGFGSVLGIALLAAGAAGGLGLLGAGAAEGAAAAGMGELAAADMAAGLLPEFGSAAVGASAGITGNAAIDGYLSNLPTSIAKNAALQMVTSGEIDPGKLVTGTIAGGLNAYGNSLISDLGLDPSIAKGLTAAAVGTGMGVVQGQDIGDALKGGLLTGAATGVGNAVGSAVREGLVDNEISNAAAQNNTVIDGEQAFSDTPTVETPAPVVADTGSSFSDILGDIGTAITDIVSPNTAGQIAGTVAGTVTGGLLSGVLVDTQQPAAQPEAVAPEPDFPGVSFTAATPQYHEAPRETDWNTRRLGNG